MNDLKQAMIIKFNSNNINKLKEEEEENKKKLELLKLKKQKGKKQAQKKEKIFPPNIFPTYTHEFIISMPHNAFKKESNVSSEYKDSYNDYSVRSSNFNSDLMMKRDTNMSNVVHNYRK